MVTENAKLTPCGAPPIFADFWKLQRRSVWPFFWVCIVSVFIALVVATDGRNVPQAGPDGWKSEWLAHLEQLWFLSGEIMTEPIGYLCDHIGYSLA